MSSYQNPTKAETFASTAELADLGRARYDSDMAQISDRDHALYSQQPFVVRQGRAPKGLETQVFAWNTYQFTTEDKDGKDELHEDLHEGQLHRQNRAAREPQPMLGHDQSMSGRGGRAARGGRGGRGGAANVRNDGPMDPLCCGRKPEGNVPPLAKGFAEELDKSLFWNEPIV